MGLKIGDIVEVVITNVQLCGLHIVQIKNFEQYDAILLYPSNVNNTRQNKIYYNGLKLLARVLRIHENYIDLVQIPTYHRI